MGQPIDNETRLVEVYEDLLLVLYALERAMDKLDAFSLTTGKLGDRQEYMVALASVKRLKDCTSALSGVLGYSKGGGMPDKQE